MAGLRRAGPSGTMAEEEGRFTYTPGEGSQVEAKTPVSGTEGTADTMIRTH